MARVAQLGRLDPVLADIGLSRAQLDVLMTLPEDAGRQFEAMAGSARVDLNTLPPAVLRDATWTCMVCRNAAACRTWQRGGGWRGDGDSRCPNAALLRH